MTPGPPGADGPRAPGARPGRPPNSPGLVGPRGEILRAAPASGPSAGGGPAPAPVVDVDARTFEAEVLRRSLEIPVVVDLWAPWCGPCKTLSPVLERLAREAPGRFVLAKVNVDETPDVAAAFGARSIPTVVAIVQGRPVDAFVGALPEREIRKWLDRVAPAGAAGTGTAAAPAADPEDLLGAGRLDEARSAFSRRLEGDPADSDAILGLARAAALAGRPAEAEGYLRGLPASLAEAPRAEAVRAATGLAREASPAGKALAAGDAAAACDALLDEIRAGNGEARARLVALLDVMGRKAPAAEAARERLARLLF